MQAIWKLAVQEGKQIQGLKLVSRQFRTQRLALWAAGRGPDPSVGVLALREGPLTGAVTVQDESQLQEDASKLEAGSAGRQANWSLKLVSRQLRKQRLALWAAGRGPIRHCHGVLALRDGPLTGAVQDESQLQEDASKLEAGSAGRQANWRFEARF